MSLDANFGACSLPCAAMCLLGRQRLSRAVVRCDTYQETHVMRWHFPELKCPILTVQVRSDAGQEFRIAQPAAHYNIPPKQAALQQATSQPAAFPPVG